MSTSRACTFWLATDKKWYVMLGDFEYAYEEHQCTFYGPFNSEENVENYVSDNFSNPGGSNTDRSGNFHPPEEPVNPSPPRRFGSPMFISR